MSAVGNLTSISSPLPTLAPAPAAVFPSFIPPTSWSPLPATAMSPDLLPSSTQPWPPLWPDDEGPFRSSHQLRSTHHRLRHGGQRPQRASPSQRRERERRRRRRIRHTKDGKKRRSLNVADPERERLASLYSIRHNSVLEITPDGQVQTAPNKSSIFSHLLFVFWCNLLQNCPRPDISALPGRSATSTVVRNVSSSSDHYSDILLLFKHSDRYLCIDRRGHIYSRKQDEPTSNLIDCVLKHKVISREFDVLMSHRHPKRPSSCRRTSSRQHVSSSLSRVQRRCRRKWYLGVTGRGLVRTIKTYRFPPPRKTFFYKTWVHKNNQPTQQPPFGTGSPLPNPFALTTTPPPTTTERRWRGGKKWRRRLSRPAFPLLSFARRRNGSRQMPFVGRNETVTRVDNTKPECGSNLLSNCGRQRNSSEDRPARVGRRRLTVVRRRGSRRRSALLRSR